MEASSPPRWLETRQDPRRRVRCIVASPRERVQYSNANLGTLHRLVYYQQDIIYNLVSQCSYICAFPASYVAPRSTTIAALPHKKSLQLAVAAAVRTPDRHWPVTSTTSRTFSWCSSWSGRMVPCKRSTRLRAVFCMVCHQKCQDSYQKVAECLERAILKMCFQNDSRIWSGIWT